MQEYPFPFNDLFTDWSYKLWISIKWWVHSHSVKKIPYSSRYGTLQRIRFGTELEGKATYFWWLVESEGWLVESEGIE